MAADLGLLSLNHLQKLSQSTNNQTQVNNNPNSGAGGGSWMWNPSHHQKQQQQVVDQELEDESWEVRAFAEDTNNIMGTTWPPRSYTCTFCRREFRSAQALGGHMNVHRRDRARLHHHPPHSSSALIQQFTTASSGGAGGGGSGLCVLYQLQGHNSFYAGTTNMTTNACNNLDSPSPNSFLASAGAGGELPPAGLNHHYQYCYNKLGEATASSSRIDYSDCNNCKKESSSTADNTEELDLELHL